MERKTEKKVKTDLLTSIGKQPGESLESVSMLLQSIRPLL